MLRGCAIDLAATLAPVLGGDLPRPCRKPSLPAMLVVSLALNLALFALAQVSWNLATSRLLAFEITAIVAQLDPTDAHDLPLSDGWLVQMPVAWQYVSDNGEQQFHLGPGVRTLFVVPHSETETDCPSLELLRASVMAQLPAEMTMRAAYSAAETLGRMWSTLEMDQATQWYPYHSCGNDGARRP